MHMYGGNDVYTRQGGRSRIVIFSKLLLYISTLIIVKCQLDHYVNTILRRGGGRQKKSFAKKFVAFFFVSV
jgi:hypothetical protein